MEFQTRTRDETAWMSWMAGMAIGAIAMYIADPSEGRRRRALLQDKMSSYSARTQRVVSGKMRDARNRFSGLQAEAMRMISPRQAKPIDNHVLEARVRSRIARAMPQLDELTVEADEGMVTLSGDLPAEDERTLLDLVEGIPGVEAVRYAGQAWDDEGGGLAGRGGHGGRVTSMFAGRSPLWIAGAAGAGLLTWYALTRRQPLGLLAVATSVGLMGRRGRSGLREAASSAMHASGEGFDAERTIDIQATPETVYDIWSRYENFPHFMSHVIEVRDLGDRRSHWVVQGPGGSEVEFNSVLTAAERPHYLAWHSEPGSRVQTEGTVTLAPQAGGTRATVRMSWQPPAGALGQGVAVLTGADPQSALDEDLQRMKQFIERGLPSRSVGGGAGTTGSTGSGNVLH